MVGQGESSQKLSHWAHGLRSELMERGNAIRAKSGFHAELGDDTPAEITVKSLSVKVGHSNFFGLSQILVILKFVNYEGK